MSNPSIIFSKTFKSGRFVFRADVWDNCTLDLIRLPKIDLPDDDEESYHYPQMCSVCYKPALTCEALGWDEPMTVEEVVARLNENANFESKLFVVSEYTGRETSSENLTPDTALDGFLEWEINVALQMLDADQEIVKRLESRYADIILIER